MGTKKQVITRVRLSKMFNIFKICIYFVCNFSFFLADYGNLYQKKFLIDAKWWRMWKEFVQFDSKDDDDESKEMVFNIRI
jgi:hypothetical protein